MRKPYIRKSDLTYVGRHGVRQKDCYELPEELVGKSIKVVDGFVVLDEEADEIRLAAELVEETDRKMDAIRAERNRRLSESDHTQLADAPIVTGKQIRQQP